MDYFKFCLLDFDKHELRQKLIRNHQLKVIKKIDDKITGHKQDDRGSEYVPKNREIHKFMQAVNNQSHTEDYLSKKRSIMASHKGIKQASDNLNDHAYGKRQTQTEDKIHELLKYHFVKPQ